MKITHDEPEDRSLEVDFAYNIFVMTTLADLRKNYSLGGLTEADAGTDPFALFERWFVDAVTSGLHEPNAMTLATVNATGQPSARAVLLKALDPRGFTFFTNYNSRKAHELAENPRAALLFLWHPLERQVRVEGVIEKVTAEESDEYFVKRPLGSRLGAWASPQSAVIPDREFLQIQHDQLLAQYADGQVPRPEHWGGYRLLPNMIEFWQGRQNRLHDRIRFQKSSETSWQRDRLAP